MSQLVDLRRLLRRAGLVIFVLADAFLLYEACRAPLSNPDTYFHLRFGKEFLDGWSIAHPGQLSSASSATWVPTQWLGQLLWITAYDHGGAATMAVLYGVLLCLFGVALYFAGRTCGSPLPSFMVASVAMWGSLHWLALRPQLLSYLGAALVVLLCNRSYRSGRPPWLIVPLCWIWAMCHGMWVLGVVITAVAVVAVLLEQRPGPREAARWLAVPLLAFAATLATPVGPKLVGAVLLVNSRSDHFAEWAPEPLLSGWGLTIGAALGLLLVLRLRRGPTPPYPLAMVGLSAVFALYSGRTVVIALVVATPLLSAELSRRTTEPARRREAAAAAGVLAASLALSVLAGQALLPTLAEKLSPFDAQLTALPRDTVVITERNDGAVLLWTHPDLEIPVHGYGDVFTDAELQRYDDLTQLQPGWLRTLQALHARYALLPADDGLRYALTLRGWRAVQRADGRELLVAPGS